MGSIVHSFRDDKTSKVPSITYDARSVIIYNETSEPSIDPVANPPSLSHYVIKRSSPLAVLYIKSAGKMGTDEPPVLMLSMVGQSSFHLDIHLSS
jgi:hypothetical protein